MSTETNGQLHTEDDLAVAAPELSKAGEGQGGTGGILRRAVAWGEIGRTKNGFRPLVLLGVLYVVFALEGAGFTLAQPDIVRDTHIDFSQLIGLVITASLFLGFGQILMGWWADRHSRIRLLGLGTIVAGLSSLWTSRASSFGALAGARVGNATGGAAANTPIFALLADYYPLEVRGRLFSLISTLKRVATVGGLGLSGLLFLHFGWRDGIFAYGAIMVVGGALAVLWLRDPIRGYFERKALGLSEAEAAKADPPQSMGEAWRATWSLRVVRRTFLGDAVIGIADSAFALFFNFYLAEVYQLNIAQRTLVFIPTILAGLLGGFIGGGLADVFSRRNPSFVLRLLGVFTLLGTLSIIGAALQPPILVLVAISCVGAFGASLIGPASGVVYSQVIPPNVRTQGLNMTSVLSGIPGVFALGVIWQPFFSVYGYQQLFWALIPFYVVGAIIYFTAGDFFEVDRRNMLLQSAAAEEWKKTRAEGKGKVLVCRGVDVEYDGTQVLFGVDFDIEEGELVALLGTNGAGKSTLLRAISGSQHASGGAVVFDGREITHMPPHEIARRGVSHMPGGRGVFPELTVRENLQLGTWMHESPAERRRLLDEVDEIFPQLKRRRGQLASELSGGEQQMLSLAQAFLSKPVLMMIDELSLGLSPAVVGELVEIVKKLNERGITIIVVEQSVNVALTLAKRAIFMEKGEVKFVGETQDLLRRPDILRAVYVKGTGGAGTGGQTDVQADAAKRWREQEMASAPTILAAKEIRKSFGGILALDDISLDLKQGQILGLVGPNGSGKTTLFDIISGYQRPDSGRVFYDGNDVTDLPAHERAARKLIRRFQDARLYPAMTVYETLLVTLDQRMEVRNSLLHGLALPQARRAERRTRARADRLIELLELQSYRDKFVRELSTGVRRIVDLACVLAQEPKVLMLDEPSTGIAQAEAEGLAPLLRRVKFETDCSILVIEHDMPLLTAIADELMALDLGQVIARGPADAVLNNEKVIESYLGSSEAAIKRSGILV